MKKRFVSMVLCLALILSLLPTAALAVENDMPFTDVQRTDWFYDAVQYVWEKGMMNGTGETTFEPDTTTTRGMIVTILHRVENMPSASGMNFTDVADNAYYANSVAWASANGIVDGYGNGKFGPDDPITREQMATILYRYSAYKEYDVTASADLSHFVDGDKISSYAADAMAWANAEGLITGISSTAIDPQGGATRAQVATILMRFCENVAKQTETYTVTFNLNYGTNGVYKTEKIATGKTISEPEKPIRSGYTFNGWYTSASGGSKFDFNKKITENVTLYAHWSKSQDPIYYYTVKFDTVASDVQGTPQEQQVRSGNTVAEPSAPSRDGYTFTGWYIDSTYIEKYDFKSPVTANITLYAKWNIINTEPNPEEDNLHHVTFELNDGSPGVYEIQIVQDGKNITMPAEPERELYRFTGWYEEPSGAIAYDFDRAVTEDLTLYAGWGSPDPDAEGLYAASNTEETVYSVSGLFMDDTGATATVSINSESVLLVEFFEDTLDESWTKEAMNNLLNESPVASVAAYTPDYGELINVSVPVDSQLPQYYIARVRLLSLEGDDLCDPFLYIEGSKQYAEFEKKTINDYSQDQVVNFDESITTNFGVLIDDAKKITVSDTVNKLTVADIDVEDKIVPDHTYTFESPDNTVNGLIEGDIVYIVDTQYLFKIKTITITQTGSVVITPDNDAQLTDFYSTLKVDMGSASDDGIQPMIDIIDVDRNLSKEFGFPSVEVKPENWLTIKWNANFKENLDIKMVYDYHLFGEDYFEFSFISQTTIETSAAIEASPGDDKGENPLKWDLLGNTGSKASIPTTIPGLEVYTKLGLPVELKLTAGISATWAGTMKSGFIYNSYSGRNDIKDMEKSLELKAEGKAELKVGPEVAVGVQLTGGVVSAEINASGGAKISAAVSASDEDVLDNVSSKHTCILCISGEAKWFAEVHIKAQYNICKALSGDLFDYKLIGIEDTISFPGAQNGEFYISIIPGNDSVFSNNTNNSEMFLGGGTCPNIAYRTELKTTDENEVEISGNAIHVLKNNGGVDETGTSTYITYLHNGIYSADASINGTSVSKSFVIKGNAKTVILTPSSGDGALSGKIVDSTNKNVGLQDVSVKISQNGLVITSVTSDSNGNFNVSLPDGIFLVEITKAGYIPFSSYEKIENAETTYMQTVELIPGGGLGGFRGVITDAVTNEPVGGVTLQLRSGWGNSSNGDVIKTLTTDSNGEFRYNTRNLFGLTLGLPCGNYTLSASKDGYIETNFNIIILPGETDMNPQQNATMVPALTQDDTYRIVLTWGENPRDLDSHVVGTLTNGNSFHVYFPYKSQYDGDLEVCNLDIDDTTSYGPETITLNVNNDTPYYYYIYRFAGSGTVASSGAQVKVYHGSDVIRSFNVPTGLGDGDYWNVFAIVDGQLKVQNTITDNADISYASTADNTN